MKWTDCTSDNADFTNNYDKAARVVRAALGSYDKIAHLIFSETGASVSGVSVRRWLKNRNLPITYACTLVDLVNAVDDFEIALTDFYPYLEDYVDGFLN